MAALTLFSLNSFETLAGILAKSDVLATSKFGENWLKISDAISLYAVETLLAKISKAERRLRSMFLRRVDAQQLWEAALYFGHSSP